MPRHVRNAWIECRIPGRSSSLSGGPRGKDDGMNAHITVRENGGVSETTYKIEVAVYDTSKPKLTVCISRRSPSGVDVLCDDTFDR